MKNLLFALLFVSGCATFEPYKGKSFWPEIATIVTSKHYINKERAAYEVYKDIIISNPLDLEITVNFICPEWQKEMIIHIPPRTSVHYPVLSTSEQFMIPCNMIKWRISMYNDKAK